MKIYAISFANSISGTPERSFWDWDAVEKLNLGSSAFGKDTATFDTEKEAEDKLIELYNKYKRNDAHSRIIEIQPSLVIITERPINLIPGSYSE